jgi:glycosyltransferase involved in cell wall biosynthesis
MHRQPNSGSEAGLQNSKPPAVPVRVLHLINGEFYAGAERVQDLLALRLPELGYEVAFACVRPARFPVERMSQNTRLFQFPMRYRCDLRPAWKVARLIKDNDYRLLLANTPRTAMLGSLAARLARVPLVYNVQSPAIRDSTKRWQNRANALVERNSLRNAACLICASASLAEHMRSAGFPLERIRVVANGVPALPPLSGSRPPPATWTVGMVALFRPRKGVDVLVEALSRLVERHLPVRLRLVGAFETPQYEAKIKSLVYSRGLNATVDWVPFTKDVYSELARMDLFVLPSLFGEGLPMVVLEAMAAGIPVVATNVEGIPEAIRDGRDGLIVRPNDPEDLARAIIQIIHREFDWSALGASARTRQRERFSDTNMAAGVASVYDEILKRNLSSFETLLSVFP